MFIPSNTATIGLEDLDPSHPITIYQLPNTVMTYSCGCTVTCSLSRFVYFTTQTFQKNQGHVGSKQKNDVLEKCPWDSATFEQPNNYDKPHKFQRSKRCRRSKPLILKGLQKVTSDHISQIQDLHTAPSSNENGRSKEKHTIFQTSGNGTSIQIIQ